MNTNIIITNIRSNSDQSRFGFGVTTTTGEGVYVPVGAMSMAPSSTEAGDTITAILQPNQNNPEGRTPWFAVAVLPSSDQRSEPAPESAPEPSQSARTAEDVLAYVNELNVAVTASDVSEDMDVTQEWASTTLENLHAHGKVSRISLYRQRGSGRASSTAYVRNEYGSEVFDLVRGDE